VSQNSGVSYINPNGYAVNDIEDAVPMYIGKVRADGTWLLQKYNSTTGSMTYANISNNPTVTGYNTAWTNRATLTYGGYETLAGV